MKEKQFNLLGIKKQSILYRSNVKNKNKYVVIMEGITEKQEYDIERFAKYYGQIMYKRNNNETIYAKDILLYGKIDLNDENDIRYIERFNLINEDNNQNWIYTNLDFNTGIVTTINNKLIGIGICDCIEWLEYNYILIGRPERVIIYKHYINK